MDDLQRQLGLKIRRLRERKGFTQESFADACGLHRNFMGSVERGQPKNFPLQNALSIGVDKMQRNFEPMRTRVHAWQSIASPPALEAASIRQNTGPDSRLVFKTTPNGVTIANYRLQFLIPNVYDIPVYAVSGEPAWWSSNRYDIVARAPEGTTEEQVHLMLQQLLVDRFKLKFHREK